MSDTERALSSEIASLDNKIDCLIKERNRFQERLDVLRVNNHDDHCDAILHNAYHLLNIVNNHDCDGDDSNWTKDYYTCLRCALLRADKDGYWDTDYTITLALEKYEEIK